MANIANITVKNKANADVVYVAKVPSAGDKSPARWSLDAASVIPGHRPTITVGTRSNASGSNRIMEINGAFPIVVTDGASNVLFVDKMTLKGTVILPQRVSDLTVEDAFVQFGNILVSAAFRDVAKTGYAPT